MSKKKGPLLGASVVLSGLDTGSVTGPGQPSSSWAPSLYAIAEAVRLRASREPLRIFYCDAHAWSERMADARCELAPNHHGPHGQRVGPSWCRERCGSADNECDRCGWCIVVGHDAPGGGRLCWDCAELMGLVASACFEPAQPEREFSARRAVSKHAAYLSGSATSPATDAKANRVIAAAAAVAWPYARAAAEAWALLSVPRPRPEDSMAAWAEYGRELGRALVRVRDGAT